MWVWCNLPLQLHGKLVEAMYERAILVIYGCITNETKDWHLKTIPIYYLTQFLRVRNWGAASPGASGRWDFLRPLARCQSGLWPYEKSSASLTRLREPKLQDGLLGWLLTEASVYHNIDLPGLPECVHLCQLFSLEQVTRERASVPFYDLVSKVTHNFCFVPLVRNKSLNPALTQGKGN